MTHLRPPRNEETLRRCFESAYGPEAWPDPFDIVAAARAAELPLLADMLKHAPHRPPSVPRSIHAAGAVAAVRLAAEDGSDPRGALLRLSVSARPLPGPDRPFIIGAAFRLDADPAADLVSTCPFSGVDVPWPLAAPTSTRLEAPPGTYGASRTVEGVLVEQAGHALSAAGRHRESPLFVPARRFLQRLGASGAVRFVPAPERRAAPAEDFRHALASLSVGSRLGTLEPEVGARWTITTASPFVASRHGDHELLFRHDFDAPPATGGRCPFHRGAETPGSGGA